MRHYRIVREDFYDGKGNTFDIIFFIQYRVNFMGITWWRYYRHRNLGVKTIGRSPLQFTSTTDAEDFIKKIIKEKKKYNRWNQIIIKEIS